LSSEHPQAVAMVLASMNPSHAARVLPKLEAGLQTETLSRIGRLGNVSKEAVGEVAQHLKQRVSGFHDAGANTNDPAGKRALDAILAQMPSSSRANMEYPGRDASDQLIGGYQDSVDPAVDLTRKLRDAQLDTRGQENPTAEDRLVAQNESVQQPEAATLRLVDADGNTSNVDTVLTPSNNDADPGNSADTHPHLQSTDSINAFLLSLDPVELCRSLGNVDTRTAMLALCGLPNETSNAVLAVLPKATARKVRVKMTTLGSLHLREIDEAKEAIAKTLLGASTAANEPVQMAA
jgi:flagellar motor switch protein FliG